MIEPVKSELLSNRTTQKHTIMKKLITLLACVFASAYYANAQGTVNFANSSVSTINYKPSVNGGVGVPVGQFTVGLLYWATDPGAVNLASGSLSAFNLLRTSANFVSPGRFLGGVATTPATTSNGANAWFAVIAWQTAGFASYEAARDGGGFFGYSSVFQNPTANPNAVPIPPAAPLSGFLGIANVSQVPEPSVIALAALGFGALLLRRRKVPNQ